MSVRKGKIDKLGFVVLDVKCQILANKAPLCKGIPLLREMSRRDKGFAVFARKASRS